jgi:hypothetical protein
MSFTLKGVTGSDMSDTDQFWRRSTQETLAPNATRDF